MSDFIELRTSDGSTLIKAFKVIDYQTTPADQARNLVRTLGGNIDLTIGGSYEMFRLTLLAPEESAQADYGDLDDLEAFYEYDNPAASPSNVITYVDVAGDSHSVYLLGKPEATPITMPIVGTGAWFVATVDMIVKP